jgi:hypothetical protein
MDSWILDVFGNDAAGEWVDNLELSGDLSFIHSTLNRVINCAGELEGQDSETALAAVETLLRLKGIYSVRNASTELVDEWVSMHPLTVEKDTCELAQKTIDRILRPPSELLELWEESNEFELWKKALQDFKRQLNC